MKFYSRFGLLLFLVLTCHLSSKAQVKLDNTASWSMLFEDEFTSFSQLEMDVKDTIDPINYIYILDDQRCGTHFEFSSETAEINDGILSLIATRLDTPKVCADGNTSDYKGLMLKYGQISSLPAVCSHIDQKVGFRYGLYEIRCKLPKDEFIAHFWLYNNIEEWNILETKGDGLPTNAHDYIGQGLETEAFNTSQTIANRRTCGVYIPIERDLTEYFHTYSFMWDYDNRTLTWFFDGREIRTETRQNIFDCNQPFIFGITQSNNQVDTGRFDVDYVRVLGLNNPMDTYRYKYESSSLPQNEQISSAPDALALGNAEWIFYRNSQNKVSSLRLVNGSYVHGLISREGRQEVDGDITVGSGNTVFYRGNDDQLHVVTYDGTFWNDERINGANISDLFGGSLASNLSSGGGNHVYFRSPDGWISHYYKHQTNGWVFGNIISDYNLNHKVNGDIVVGDNGQVFYVGADNRIQMYSWSPTNGWSHNYIDNYWSTNEYKASSSSGALQISDGTLFYRGLDNRIHTFSYDHVTQRWVNEVLPFEIPEDFVDGEIALPKKQGEEVYFIGADGYIQHCFLYKDRWLHRWVDERVDHTTSENIPNGTELAAFFNSDHKNIIYIRDNYLRIFKDIAISNGELVNLTCGVEIGDPESEELSFRGVEQEGEDFLNEMGNNILTIMPNPALRGNNLEVKLSYSTKRALEFNSQKKASVSIYDSSGRLVSINKEQVLLEGPQDSLNEYSFNFNSSTLSSGLYTIVLTLSDSGEVKVGRFIIQ